MHEFMYKWTDFVLNPSTYMEAISFKVQFIKFIVASAVSQKFKLPITAQQNSCYDVVLWAFKSSGYRLMDFQKCTKINGYLHLVVLCNSKTVKNLEKTFTY